MTGARSSGGTFTVSTRAVVAWCASGVIALLLALVGWSLGEWADSRRDEFVALVGTANDAARQGVAGVRRVEEKLGKVNEQLATLNANVLSLKSVVVRLDRHEDRIDALETGHAAAEQWRAAHDREIDLLRKRVDGLAAKLNGAD